MRTVSSGPIDRSLTELIANSERMTGGVLNLTFTCSACEDTST